MIVCVCRRVSDKDIQREAHSGCSTFADLQMELGVATCCGRCGDCAKEVFESAQIGAGGFHGHGRVIPMLLAA
ncbi:hypothetical protein BH09PSE5_BH09PSE5_01490 [soil metagenome]